MLAERLKNWFVFHNSHFLSVLKKFYSYIVRSLLSCKSTVILPEQNLPVYVLFDRYLGIGDLIMISPLLEAILTRHKCTLVTSWPQIFDLPVRTLTPERFRSSLQYHRKYTCIIISPTINLRHTFYLYKSQFFCGFFADNIFFCNFNSGVHAVFDSRKGHYRDRIKPILAALNLPDVERLAYPRLQGKAYDVGMKRYFVIAPFLRSLERRWPKDRFYDLVEFLRREYGDVLIVIVGSGSPLEIQYNQAFERYENTVNLTGKTSILELINIIDGSIAFFGNDSGPAHISYLCRCHSFVVFGGVSPESRLPIGIGKKHVLFNPNVCHLFPCWNTSDRNECKNHDKYECINSISSSDMIEMVREKLSGT